MLVCYKDDPYHDRLFPSVIFMDIAIHHNPRCGHSRIALAAIRAAGFKPHIVDDLATPPAREELLPMLAAAGSAPRARDTLYAELGNGAAKVGDDASVDAMLAHPVPMNRPFVVTPKGVRLCRSPETVREMI